MALQPILSVIQPVTIDTMLNKNGMFLKNGLKNVKCEQTLRLIIAFCLSLQVRETEQTIFKIFLFCTLFLWFES